MRILNSFVTALRATLNMMMQRRHYPLWLLLTFALFLMQDDFVKQKKQYCRSEKYDVGLVSNLIVSLCWGSAVCVPVIMSVVTGYCHIWWCAVAFYKCCLQSSWIFCDIVISEWFWRQSCSLKGWRNVLSSQYFLLANILYCEAVRCCFVSLLVSTWFL